MRKLIKRKRKGDRAKAFTLNNINFVYPFDLISEIEMSYE